MTETGSDCIGFPKWDLAAATSSMRQRFSETTIRCSPAPRTP